MLTSAGKSGKPIQAKDFKQLAALTRLTYSYHAIFMQIDKTAWLKHLERQANTKIKSTLELLKNFLNENAPPQWLVLDAFGLPLMDLILHNIEDWFPAWRFDKLDFVLANNKTTTDEFYQSLLDSEHAIKIVKINTIDEQIHRRFLPFDDLCRIIKTELSIAIKKRIGQSQPGSSLMISADHGFRIAASGQSYQHGSSSTLERINPLIFLQPI